MGILEKFINKMSREREFLMKGGFFLFTFLGIATVIARLFYFSTPILRQIFITREYVIGFMMMYFLNEWAKLHASSHSTLKVEKGL